MNRREPALNCRPPKWLKSTSTTGVPAKPGAVVPSMFTASVDRAGRRSSELDRAGDVEVDDVGARVGVGVQDGLRSEPAPLSSGSHGIRRSKRSGFQPLNRPQSLGNFFLRLPVLRTFTEKMETWCIEFRKVCG